MRDLSEQTIGPYRLVDKLGDGGMATVYKAYHPRLDRYVALKYIHPELVAAPGFLQRFEREAQILARLAHPNIVHLYDFGEADGHCYLAMEYGAGGTLKDRQQALQAAGRCMALDEVQSVLLQVSAGLDCAHQHGIIHRDIKPSNILLTDDGRALLSDFGLSRMLDIPSDLTSLGAMLGTPAYLSPEQGRGETGSIGPASDVYALGVVLYELLTGHLPFTAETPLAVVLKQLTAPIPSARALNPALPEGLEAVLRTALAKDPAARYQRAGELAQAFQRAVVVMEPSELAVALGHSQRRAEPIHTLMPREAAPQLSAQADAPTMTATLAHVTTRRAVAAEQPLLMTKVSLPLLRHILVPRKKPLWQLSEGVQDGHLLTLVSAPAGYGKTTTIRMWVREAGHPVAWVTLEKSDNDLRQFLTYVLTALQQAGDNLGQAALEVVENTQQMNLQRILGLLINDLYELDQPIVLVLEDYHLIENENIDQVIELMLNQALANLHLVITTREDPNLPLTRLRVRNQLTEIRAIDLSFSLEEAGEFFSNVMGVNLSKKEMEILKNRTEGWVAGLQLAALSLKESDDPSKFVEAFRGTHRHVLDYLIEEVLNSQPEEVRVFLHRTSILDQLSPSLCEAVTGQVASRKYLHYLENNNLFLVSLDEERTWYRYHALFGELLKNQLLQAEPERVDDLHERAADWYQTNGFIQKAVEHAFQMSNSSTVSTLIEKHAIPMLYQGEVSTVVGWFDRLPESLIQYSPMLCIGKAWSLALLQRQTRTEEVEQALQAANEALNLAHADEAARNLIAGHIASIQAFLMQSPAVAGKKPEKLIETSQKAQQLLPENEKAIRSVNALNIGYGYTALADLPAAERAYIQAFEDGVAGGNWYAAIYGAIDSIVIAIIKGQLKDALQSCETNIDRFNQLVAGQRFPPIGDLSILKGSILLEENRLAEAEQVVTQGLSLVRWTGEYDAHIRGYSALARLRSIQGDWTGMLESIKMLEETRPEVAIYAQALRHRLSVRDWAANKTSLEQAHLWVTQAAVRFNNIPDITGVDPVSRISFQAYLSAGHILTRLAARNPQAYSLLDVHKYLARQERFADTHELVGWLVEIWIVRALMYQVEARVEDANHMIQAALSVSAQRGYFRIFLDEGDLVRPLLESAEARLKDNDLSAFVKSLLGAMPGESAKGKTNLVDEERLSDRELEVLRLLAAGQTYKEIGQQLFLSLNTVQFHIKNIYGKLSVNRRVQAIEKAREKKLI